MYPIPRMDECIDSLGEAAVFPKVDADGGYWQDEIENEDQDKKIFPSHHGLYRFVWMPFQLWNAPSTFRRTIDVAI